MNGIYFIVILVAWTIGLLYFGLKKMKEDIKKNQKEDEFFNINEIDITSPMQIGYIVDDKIKYNHIIAVMLFFIDKKYIKAKKIVKDDKSITYELYKEKLDIFNSSVYSDLKNINKKNVKQLLKNGISISDIYTINRIVFNDYDKVDVKTIEKFYDNKECDGSEIVELDAKLQYAEKILVKELELYRVYIKDFKELTEFRKRK